MTTLEAGQATLEVANPAQRRMIDRAEVGHPPRVGSAWLSRSPTRPDTPGARVDAGAVLVARLTVTPWHSLSSRLDGTVRLQLTLLEEVLPLSEGEELDGFGTDRDRPAER